MTLHGHIYVRRADTKYPRGLVYSQYTIHDKISKQNMTKHGTQATGLGIVIGKCSPDSQYERPDYHPAKVGCSFFRYTNNELRNHSNQRRKHKTRTREDNQLA